MKRVLIYGDSLTWGRVAKSFNRFDENTRFTKVAQKHLGREYELIEEGLRARMLKGENLFVRDRDGLVQFGPILASHLPLDLLVIFLGSNDTNSRANKTAEDIAGGLDDYFANLNDWCKEFGMNVPKVLLVAPPVIQEQFLKGDSMFEGAAKKTHKFAKLYAQKAQSRNAQFFDSAQVVTTCQEDGVHLDAENNLKLGKALAEKIKTII